MVEIIQQSDILAPVLIRPSSIYVASRFNVGIMYTVIIDNKIRSTRRYSRKCQTSLLTHFLNKPEQFVVCIFFEPFVYGITVLRRHVVYVFLYACDFKNYSSQFHTLVHSTSQLTETL